MTAAELMAELQSDPEWVRQDQEREALHKARVQQLKAELEPEEGPLTTELAALGYGVESVWDLVNTSASYPEAIPVLAKYLRLARHAVLREGIARALTVKEAQGTPAAREVLEQLQRRVDEPSSEARWTLANALTVVADPTMADEIKSLVADARYEDVHERLRAALKKLHVD